MTGPHPIWRVLEQTLAGLGMGEARRLIEIQELWPELGEERWVREGRPVVLRDAELVVEVEDGAAASLLRYATGRIQARLEESLGPGVVRSVRVVVARKGRS